LIPVSRAASLLENADFRVPTLSLLKRYRVVFSILWQIETKVKAFFCYNSNTDGLALSIQVPAIQLQ
jgi:hypothetical protein